MVRGDVVVVVVLVTVLVLGAPASKSCLQGVAKSLLPFAIERRGGPEGEVDRCLPVLVNHVPVHELVVALLVVAKDSIPGIGVVRNKKRLGRAGR
jgi:hypothetical protein